MLTVFEGEVKTFTQDEVNSIVAKEVGDFKTKVKTLQDTVESTLNNAKLAKGEKEALENKLKESMTTVELAEREKQRITSETAKQLEITTEAAKNWQNRFMTSTIRRDLYDAAISNDAFSPEQIATLLSGAATLEEILEGDKPTGNFVTKVALDDKDTKGNPIKLVLTASEAVKKMKEMPDRFGNLFKGALKTGTGTDGTGKAGKEMTLAEAAKDAQTYRENRTKLGMK
jgi:hypothetical protein